MSAVGSAYSRLRLQWLSAGLRVPRGADEARVPGMSISNHVEPGAEYASGERLWVMTLLGIFLVSNFFFFLLDTNICLDFFLVLF